MTKRFISVFCLLALLMPLLFACKTDVEPDSSGGEITGYEFTVAFGSTVFKAEKINTYLAPKSDGVDDIIIYTRDYEVDGEPSVKVEYIGNRTLVTLTPDDGEGSTEFSVAEKLTGDAIAHIPVNGFVLSLPSDMLENVRCAEGSIAKVNGFSDAVGRFESHEFATFSNNDNSSVSTRRIKLIDPLTGLEDNSIYFITDEYTSKASVPEGGKTYLLEKTTSAGYQVVSSSSESEQSAPDKGYAKLILIGKYNLAYGDEYLKDGDRIMVSSLDKANSYSDVPAVVIDGNVYKFDDSNTNLPSPVSDGIYIYTANNSERVTPSVGERERIDVAVVDGIVASVAEPERRTLIPNGNGVTLTAVGENAVKALKTLNIGDKPQLLFIDTYEISERFVRIGDSVFNIDIIDGLRQPEGVCVLYTSAYGKSTGANQYGTEIAVSDGKVIAVNVGEGDTEIPDDGYVLSIHKDNAKYSSAKEVSVGEGASLTLSGADYSVTELKYDGINTVRSADTLIIYRNQSTTGTNIYGYEILVDKDGYVIGDATGGNCAIPEGGFVLSGHGENQTKLRDIYMRGERVVLDTNNSTATVIRTPELKITNAEDDYKNAVAVFDAVKQKLRNIDYTSVGNRLDIAKALIDESEKALAEYDYAAAIANAESVMLTLDRIDYAMIESHGVENRAMWYRSSEKSDDEVRTTLAKLKSLNVNALYIETWFDGSCIGFVDVDSVTHHSWLNGDYDALEGFIRIGHEMGIEIHAWVENFFVGYTAGDSYTSELAKKYAEKLLIDKKGRNYFYYHETASFVFLNPYDRECRDIILEVYRQLLTKYDLDGLHLDYIRFPELNYIDGTSDFGYNDDIIEAFRKETGITGDPRNFAQDSAEQKAWIEFRCEIITSFVKEVRDMTYELKPDIWLSAATYPDPQSAHDRIFQDVRTWVKNGWMDEVFSMTYSGDNSYVSENASMYSAFCKGNSFYSTGLAAFSDTAQADFARQLTEVREAGADGVAVFSLGSVFPSTYQYEIVEGAFRLPSTQSAKLSVTVSAGMDYISGKLDNLSSIYQIITADNIKSIKAICTEIKTDADAFELDSATIEQKISYCESTAKRLDKFASEVKDICGDNAESLNIVDDINELSYWLRLTDTRLAKRK